MALTKLQFQPGINRETTNYANEGGWYDGNRVRFRDGLPETIGGWTRVSGATYQGVCRSLIGWRLLDGSQVVGLGTHLKYYLGRGGGYYDITPVRDTTAAGAVTFAATNGSSIVTVTDTAHGATAGDFVTFSGAAGLGGNILAAVLNKEHQVVSAPTSDSYTIDVGVLATAGDTGNGGASVVGEYQVPTGLSEAVSGSGWSAGTWGESGWGSPSDTSVGGAQLRVWSHTAYGEDLVINPRGGGVYYWDRTGGLSARAVELASLPGAATTPTIANSVLLSERDRHLIVFGCDDEFTPGVLDPLLIRFSSQESLTEWRSLPTTTAGSLRISSGSEIVTAVQTRQQILVLTDVGAHSMQFLGPPFTFGLSEIAGGTTIAGQNAAVAVGDEVFWMGRGEFYRFSGLVQQVPCSVKSYVFEDINADQYAKIYGGHNSAFGEVWWFYPSAGSLENDRYVVFNYLQGIWYYGTLSRTAWMDRGIFSTPTAASPDYRLYYHEAGVADGDVVPAVALNSYIESSPIDLGEGDRFMFIRRMIPDVTFARSSHQIPPSATMTITMRNFPGSAMVGTNQRAVTQTVDIPIEQFTEQVYLRLRGRSAIFKISSDAPGTAWRLGSPRIELRTDGAR
jgi:hypothetical protein